MNCKEFEEQISAAVDRYLNGSERALFEGHAQECPPCRRAYEDEMQTKVLVRKRMEMIQTPAVLTTSILGHLTLEIPDRVNFHTSFLKTLFDLLTPRFAFGLAVVSVLVVIVATRPPFRFWESAPPRETTMDVIDQSHENYEAMIGSGIKPQMVSSKPEFVKNFFVGKTDFAVHVPSMKDCTLLGGGINDIGGAKFANVVYQGNSGMIYLCQMCLERAMRGDKINLSAEAKHDIERTGWHKCKLPDGDALVLWSRGGTLCAALAKMTPDDLAACLTSGETPQW